MAKPFLLYIIRHAQSANNALPESQRVEDPAITELGQRQAAYLADRFRDQAVTHLLTSGFLRAVQTMRPLGTALGRKPAIWTDLHEVGGCYRGYEPGRLEGRPGMNRTTLSSRFPEFELPDDVGELGWWQSKPYETPEQARHRADQQGARLLAEFGDADACVACVTHADFKALLLQALLGEDEPPALLLNTGVTLLRIAADNREIVEFNCVSHLQQELVTR